MQSETPESVAIPSGPGRARGARRLPRNVMRRTLAPLVAVAVLAVPAAASAASFTAKLSIPTHTPAVGGEKIKITVTRGTQKLSGSVNYRFLFEGQVVSKQPGHSFKNGVFTDLLLWPKKAIGEPITLQVVVSTKYGTQDLNWWIKVKA